MSFLEHIRVTKDNQGRYHSFDDEAATIDIFGYYTWYIHGKQRRKHDQPSYVSYFTSTGNIHYAQWTKNELLHRRYFLPAYVFYNGLHLWRRNGKSHFVLGIKNLFIHGISTPQETNPNYILKTWNKTISEKQRINIIVS